MMLVLSSNNDTVPEMVIVSTWQSAVIIIFAKLKATKNAKVKFLSNCTKLREGVSESKAIHLKWLHPVNSIHLS